MESVLSQESNLILLSSVYSAGLLHALNFKVTEH